ncbi:hypothetical protein ASG82_17560 [Mycobacterium sp. Soil538]|nr:hypothetical protein ASG82_17560 [Mycobacterium sp. Soil538]
MAVIPTRRDGRRTLCAAEGVLAVLRHCSLDDAFADIVRTAQRHNVAPLRLAEALLAAIQCDTVADTDRAAMSVVEQTWGELLRTARLLAPCL